MDVKGVSDQQQQQQQQQQQRPLSVGGHEQYLSHFMDAAIVEKCGDRLWRLNINHGFVRRTMLHLGRCGVS